MGDLRRILRTLFVGALPVFGMSYCYNREVEEAAGKARAREEDSRALEGLLNPATMEGEVDRRLREMIKVIPPLIIVHNPFGSYAIPATTPWSIECGPFSGLKIKFGEILGESAITASLFDGALDNTACDTLIAVTSTRYRIYTANALPIEGAQ